MSLLVSAMIWLFLIVAIGNSQITADTNKLVIQAVDTIKYLLEGLVMRVKMKEWNYENEELL